MKYLILRISTIKYIHCFLVVNSQSMGLGGGFIMVMTLKNGTRYNLNYKKVLIVTIVLGAVISIFSRKLLFIHGEKVCIESSCCKSWASLSSIKH